MPDWREFEKIISNTKVEYMCDTFAVHSVIAKYGSDYLEENKNNGICRDNLEDCVQQAKLIIESGSFVTFVSSLTGKSNPEVRKHLAGQNRPLLAQMILAKLPTVKFEKIMEPYHSFMKNTIDFSTIDMREVHDSSPMVSISNVV